MKRKLQFSGIFFLLCSGVFAQNVPNGGFENWTAGNPDNWFTNNISGFATPITQSTTAHSGSLAVKGTVVSTVSGNLAPALYSIDMAGNGFAVTQAYSTFGFYYMQSLSTSETTTIGVIMYDAGGNPVGGGSGIYGGNVSTYTYATIPISYSGINAPVECQIFISMSDSIATGTLGSYFLLDDMSLTGLAATHDLQTPGARIESIVPNPARASTTVAFSTIAKENIRMELFSVTGQKIRDVRLDAVAAGKHEEIMDVSAVPPGNYLLKISTPSGASYSKMQILH